MFFFFFFFNDPPTPAIYTLSLHDALPISESQERRSGRGARGGAVRSRQPVQRLGARSEEHTSELQSPCNLVCRLLLEKKKKIPKHIRELLTTSTIYISRRVSAMHLDRHIA